MKSVEGREKREREKERKTDLVDWYAGVTCFVDCWWLSSHA